MLFSLSLAAVLPLVLAAPTCTLKPSSPVVAAPSATPSTPGGGGGNPPSGAGTNGTIIMSWFADWRADFGVSNINWKSYTHMAFFAGEPSSDGTVTVPVGNPSMVDDFTSAAIAHGVKPILSVGGWSSSIYWSSSVATAQNRTNFINSLVQYAHAHNFAGLDFDWEYPNHGGIGCNTKSPQDSANFLSFLQEMRQSATNLTLSADASIVTWVDSSGSPLTDVSAYAKELDWVAIMNYDVAGSFSQVTGPNSPLYDTCAPTNGQQGSAASAVDAWTKAGFPANKLVLGVASYGHAFNVSSSVALTDNKINLYTSFDKTNIPAGDSWDPASTQPDVCGNPPVGNGNSGIWHYWALIQEGYLNSDGSFASSVTGLYDNCTQTPFLYDASQSMLVSFDNPESFAAKGAYVKKSGLGGIAMYETGGDTKDGALISAIAAAMA